MIQNKNVTGVSWCAHYLAALTTTTSNSWSTPAGMTVNYTKQDRTGVKPCALCLHWNWVNIFDFDLSYPSSAINHVEKDRIVIFGGQINSIVSLEFVLENVFSQCIKTVVSPILTYSVRVTRIGDMAE